MEVMKIFFINSNDSDSEIISETAIITSDDPTTLQLCLMMTNCDDFNSDMQHMFCSGRGLIK